jgi:hypothetical protein
MQFNQQQVTQLNDYLQNNADLSNLSQQLLFGIVVSHKDT